MLKNYLLVALRSFRKHSLYSSLNVLGLMLGLTVVLLIGLYVRFELSYDEFHERSDRTYRIVQRQPDNFFLGSNEFAVTPRPLEQAIRDELAYVEDATLVARLPALIRSEQTNFLDEGIFATASFFDVFDFEILGGNPEAALAAPNAAVVTPEFAERLFGTEDAMGREFEIKHFNSVYTVTVSGLVAEVPTNSHLQFSFVLSLATSSRQDGDNWGNSSYFTYAVLRPDADVDNFRSDVQDIVTRNVSQLSWVQETGATIATYYPQPLNHIHLRSRANFDPGVPGDIRHVWLLLIAAVMIMLTACINYVNLATARATTRAREVGVRKAAGADRRQVMLQFMSESLLLALVASALAVVAATLLLPGFGNMVEREIPSSMLREPWFAGLVVVVALLVGLLSGVYPAAVLSRMQPSRVLKSAAAGFSTRSRLRNALVVTQFVVSIALVIGTVVINKQLGYMQRADTGMDRDHIVSVTVRDRDVGERWNTLRSALIDLPGVVDATSAAYVPTNIGSSTGSDEWDGKEDDAELTIYRSTVNYGYIDLLGLQLVEGRDFEMGRAVDSVSGIIINETAKRTIGWDSAVGKHINLGSTEYEVLGVVQDFQFHSSHLEINPLALSLDTENVQKVLVKVTTDRVSETLSGIESVMTQFAPAYPFEFLFLDDAYDALYSAEQKLSLAFSIVTLLALAISCLGLFGLAAFVTLQRRKEIGVRKALGASLADIMLLLSKDFSRLVLLAFAIAGPIAYFATTRWLERFAYHVDVGLTVFVVAGVVTVLVTLLTVGYHAIKASLTDPVKALRYE